jgi:hypothetical protein
MSPLDAVFTKLTLVYGTRFRDAYTGQTPGAIRQHWAHELRGIPEHAVLWALAELPPDHPPNVLQFKALCHRRPEPSRQALPHDRKHAPIPPEVKAKLAALLRRPDVGSRDWAARLRERELAGERLTRVQRAAWRSVLRESAEVGDE